MDVLFLIPHAPNPRMIKRISTAKVVGKTAVIYWDRGFSIMENNPLPRGIKKYEILVKSNEGYPLKRIFKTIKFSIKALSIIIKLHPKIIYTSKLDMLLLIVICRALKIRKPSIVYEVSDMHELVFEEPKKLIRKVIKSMLVASERLACKFVSLLVVTSPGFLDEYYCEFISKEKTLFLPNVPKQECFINYNHKDYGDFTIGWIGFVRYKNQMKLMIDAAELAESKVMIAGSGVDYENILKYVKNKSFVEFLGPYKYEKEIATLYSKIDCICSIYDSSIKNVRVALPNRFYEAVICEIPIIASKGTVLGKLVEELGVGISVDAFSVTDIAEGICKLKEDKALYNSIVEKCKKFKDEFTYSKYEEILQKKLSGILEGNI